MKLAIMQPYFFPYIGYFSLVKNTDYFIFFDIPQYIRKGWINRNRILGNNNADVYITVPIEKQHRETPINQTRISNNTNWREKIRGQLKFYKKRAPFYYDVIDMVDTVFNKEYDTVSELAIQSIVCSCEYLGLDIKYNICSQMNLPDFNVKEPDEWALNITKYMGYDTYINPPGGKSFFSVKKYENEGITLQFLEQELLVYNQRNEKFIPGLSIIDIMMFCKPEDIVDMMNHYNVEGETIV